MMNRLALFSSLIYGLTALLLVIHIFVGAGTGPGVQAQSHFALVTALECTVISIALC